MCSLSVTSRERKRCNTQANQNQQEEAEEQCSEHDDLGQVLAGVGRRHSDQYYTLNTATREAGQRQTEKASEVADALVSIPRKESVGHAGVQQLTETVQTEARPIAEKVASCHTLKFLIFGM